MPSGKSKCENLRSLGKEHEQAFFEIRAITVGEYSQTNPLQMFDKVTDNIVNITEIFPEKNYHPLAKRKVHWDDLWKV